MKRTGYLSLSLLAVNLIYSGSVNAAYLHETATVYLIEPNLAGLDFYQKYYYVNKSEYLLVREQNMLLSITPDIELGIKVPFTNYVTRELTFSRLGDVKFHLNFATDWFEKAGKFNYFLEYNVGTGASIDELTTHPMESYGHQEWRTGLIYFRKWDYFSISANLFYVFKNKDEKTLFQSFFGDGVTLNPFNEQSYRRAFGFNPKNDQAYFYEGNLKNDNMEYGLAVNSELVYPFVPFVEGTFSHDFWGAQSKSRYVRLAPGLGLFRTQLITGFKYFMADDHFSIKVSFYVPLGDLSTTYGFGAGLGVRIDF